MAKNINTILKLKDEFSKTLKTASSNTMSFDKKVKLTSNSIKKMGTDIEAAAFRAGKNILKMGAAITTVAAGVGLKEAMDLQGYRTQLDTAMKDTKAAGETMRYAIRLANKTPFEGGSLVEAAAKFEAMEMNAQEWLEVTGDMAAGTNKDIIQATEAIIDAQMGEMERLKEFGIKKETIAQYAYDKMNKMQIMNNKGQIINEKGFQDALMGLMKERFEGGMEAQSKTLRGAWSTITGITKSGLANVMGVMEDGELREGSVVDIASKKLQEWGQALIELQDSGKIDEYAESLANLTTKGFGALEKGLSYVVDNKDTIIDAGKGILKTYLALKTISITSKTITSFRTCGKAAMFLWNAISPLKGASGILAATKLGAGAMGTAFTLLMSNPLTALLAIAGAVVLIATNFDSARAAMESFGRKFDEIVNKEKTSTGYAMQMKGGTAYAEANQKIYDDAKVKETQKANGLTGSSFNNRYNSVGTSFWRGGLGVINEQNRGEIVDLPSGTRIIPHDVSKKQSQGNNISVKVYVQGNIVGNDEFAEEMAEQTAKRIILAMDNV